MKNQMFVNGLVITMNPQMPFASSFGVTGDRISSLEAKTNVRNTSAGENGVTDLDGKTVIPGFIESHTHLSSFAKRSSMVDCSANSNQRIEEVLNSISRRTRKIAPGQWILGWGYDDTLIFEKRHLSIDDLDRASPAHPALIRNTSGWVMYANSKAFEAADLDPSARELDEIEKDENGRVTGRVFGNATAMFTRCIPRPDVSTMKKLLVEAISEYHKTGITSIHDCIGYDGVCDDVIKAYRELELENKLSMRVYLTIRDKVYQKILDLGLGSGFGSSFLKLGGAKLFQDGSIQLRTAALVEPYLGNIDSCGKLIMDQNTLNEAIEHFHREGIQIAVHVNGDRAIESVICALERACEDNLNNNHRHMLIHCQLATQYQIRRMKKLGVIASYFPNHIYYWGDRHRSLFLGPERAERIDPLGTSVREGLTFTLHADTPVTPVDPLFSIHCAVNRITRDGAILGPNERIDPLAALRAYTLDAAYCSFEEHLKGSIEIGKLADFTVLSDNPLSCPPEAIKDIEIEATYVGGELVYSKS